MIDFDKKYIIFIDYDNLEWVHKQAGILDLVTRVLFQTTIEDGVKRAKCDIRVYGGWYEGPTITRLAQDISIQLQQEFPKILRSRTLNGTLVDVSTAAELAVALLQEPSHHMFDTYRRKGKPSNVRVQSPEKIGCNDSDCILPLMRRLLKSGKCPKHGCLIDTENLVYRNEQKIVDTMLTCDLIYVAHSSYDSIILVSGDDDFLPPLRTLLLHGVAAVRFNPKPRRTPFQFMQGPQLIEKDL